MNLEKPYKCRVCKGTEYKLYGVKFPRRYCVSCHKINRNASYVKNKVSISEKRKREKPHQNPEFREYQYGWKLKTRYGITLAEYKEMLVFQNNTCAICGGSANGKSNRFCVDHDHKSGLVRGLLCNKCNVGLANFKDDMNILLKASNYLERAALLAAKGGAE